MGSVHTAKSAQVCSVLRGSAMFQLRTARDRRALRIIARTASFCFICAVLGRGHRRKTSLERMGRCADPIPYPAAIFRPSQSRLPVDDPRRISDGWRSFIFHRTHRTTATRVAWHTMDTRGICGDLCDWICQPRSVDSISRAAERAACWSMGSQTSSAANFIGASAPWQRTAAAVHAVVPNRGSNLQPIRCVVPHRPERLQQCQVFRSSSDALRNQKHRSCNLWIDRSTTRCALRARAQFRFARGAFDSVCAAATLSDDFHVDEHGWNMLSGL